MNFFALIQDEKPLYVRLFHEPENLKSQNVTSSLRSHFATLNLNRKRENPSTKESETNWGGTRKLPYAFTENGVAMLSSVLRSKTAIEVNIRIMRAFTAMRSFLMNNAHMFKRLETIEHHQLLMQKHLSEHDKKIEEVLTRFDDKESEPIGGILYDGQIFDAYSLISDLVRKANYRIILIDNYVDDRVLKTLDKRKEDVTALIYTNPRNSHISQDLNRHNAQYPEIDAAKFFEKSAQMGYIKAMKAIYIYDKKLAWFDCGLKIDSILWLAEYIERTNPQINETMSSSDIVNDNLLKLISIEDLIVMRQNSNSSKVLDFCEKLERIIIQSYNSSL